MPVGKKLCLNEIYAAISFFPISINKSHYKIILIIGIFHVGELIILLHY